LSKKDEEFTMKLSRRHVLKATASAVLCGATRAVWADAYPSHPVRVIVPFAPGGPVDVLGRLIAQKLSDDLGRQFFVENLPGAGGNIGTEKAARSAADGYTLLITANNHVINPLLYATVRYDPFKDFAAVSLAVGFPTALSVNSSVQAHNVKELVALVRATPGKYSFASPGIGTPSHLLGEQFRQKLNLDLVHVPYNGSGPATQAVLAGDTQICFAALTSAAPFAKAAKLRVLATMSKTRSKALPDVPTIAQAGYPGLEGEGWVGLFVPAGTPSSIVDELSNRTRAALELPEVAQKITTLGFSSVGSTPEEFAKQLASESQTWGVVIRGANLKKL
jgi:tripartite-type tricarboxylate transporter receptor subunit TctC